MDFRVTKLKKEHISEVVNIHMLAFPNFFLTFLGYNFLKEFYSSFLCDEQGIGLVAVEEDRVFGVIVGPLKPAGYFKKLLLRKWYVFCFASIRAVLREPKTIKRLFEAFFYRGQAPQDKERALLSSIAVSPNAQGYGIGEFLVHKWIDAIRSKGAIGCFLTTDAENNDKVNRFYQHLGFVIESVYATSEGRVMNRYILDFATQMKENPK